MVCEADLATPPTAAPPAMTWPILGGCAALMAWLYDGATSSTLCRLGSVRVLFAVLLLVEPSSLLLIEFVELYRPPMRSSVSKENMRRWRENGLRRPAACAFSSISAGAPLLFLRRLMMKNIRAIAAITTTTTGTATAACIPGLDMGPAACACSSLLVLPLLAALVPLAWADELAALDEVAAPVNDEADEVAPEDASVDDVAELPVEVDAAIAVDEEGEVASVVDCALGPVFVFVPDNMLAMKLDLAASTLGVGIGGSGMLSLFVANIDAKVEPSKSLVAVKGLS